MPSCWKGEAEIANAALTRRDNIAFEGEDKVAMAARTDCPDLLLVETRL